MNASGARFVFLSTQPDDLGQFLAAAYGAMRGIQPPEMLAVFTSVLEVARPDPGKLWPLLTAFGDGLLKALRAEAELADGT